jgi:hypothetical protein
LRPRDAGKAFKKFVNPRAVFEVLKQRPNWYAAPFEQPLATAFFRYALYRWTLAPINRHVTNLAGFKES